MCAVAAPSRPSNVSVSILDCGSLIFRIVMESPTRSGSPPSSKRTIRSLPNLSNVKSSWRNPVSKSPSTRKVSVPPKPCSSIVSSKHRTTGVSGHQSSSKASYVNSYGRQGNTLNVKPRDKKDGFPGMNSFLRKLRVI